MLFYDWKNKVAYMSPGCLESQEGTMEDAMLAFFYDGVCPWIRNIGYKWSREDPVIAKKFVHFCYMINTTVNLHNRSLQPPMASHRDFDEDRETFDYFADTTKFIDFLAAWDFRTEVVGTRFDYLIKEFCYTWVNVCSGKPGAFTQRIFDAEAEADAEDELVSGPDTSSKKKWDLY